MTVQRSDERSQGLISCGSGKGRSPTVLSYQDAKDGRKGKTEGRNPGAQV